MVVEPCEQQGQERQRPEALELRTRRRGSDTGASSFKYISSTSESSSNSTGGSLEDYGAGPSATAAARGTKTATDLPNQDSTATTATSSIAAKRKVRFEEQEQGRSAAVIAHQPSTTAAATTTSSTSATAKRNNLSRLRRQWRLQTNSSTISGGSSAGSESLIGSSTWSDSFESTTSGGGGGELKSIGGGRAEGKEGDLVSYASSQHHQHFGNHLHRNPKQSSHSHSNKQQQHYSSSVSNPNSSCSSVSNPPLHDPSSAVAAMLNDRAGSTLTASPSRDVFRSSKRSSWSRPEQSISLSQHHQHNQHHHHNNHSTASNNKKYSAVSAFSKGSSLALPLALHKYKCLCGACHVVVGTRLFLLFYIGLTAAGIAFGMVSAMVWALIPLIVIPMAIHALRRNKPMFLYPFLLITIVQAFVCILMALIVVAFSLLNFDTLTSIIAYSLGMDPSTAVTLNAVGLVSFGCLALSAFFLWQMLVISSCIRFYEMNTARGHSASRTSVSDHPTLQPPAVPPPAPASSKPTPTNGGGDPSEKKFSAPAVLPPPPLPSPPSNREEEQKKGCAIKTSSHLHHMPPSISAGNSTSTMIFLNNRPASPTSIGGGIRQDSHSDAGVSYREEECMASPKVSDL